MHHYFEAITNTSGDALPGYFGRVINTANQNTVTLSADDNGTPIVTTSGVENMAKTDAYGNLSFYVQPGTYHLDIYAPNATSFIMRVPNVAMNSGVGPEGPQGNEGPQGEGLAEVMAPGGSALVGFKVPDGLVRNLFEKIVEIEVSIGEYGSGDALAATNAALVFIGQASPARLIIPRGAWAIGSSVDWSAYKNVAFVFRTGAVVDQGANPVTLPDRAVFEPGSRFTGSGAVIIRNKDEQPLATPPGGYVRTGNDARGLRAAGNLTRGMNNIAWGTDALATATTVRSTIAIGTEALKNVIGSSDASSAYGTFMGLADGNMAIGDFALRDTTTGYENIALGMYNGRNNTTGRWNVYVGPQTGILNSTGSCNVAIGPYASVTYFGDNSLAIGFGALENHNTGANLAVGHVAMNGSLTSARCTVVGAQGAEKMQDGIECVVIGQEAMRNAVHGENCTAVGAYALGQLSTGTNVNNTAIGRNAMLALMSGEGNTALGSGAMNTSATVSGATAIGLASQVTGSNQVQLGGAATTTYAYGAVQDRSDVRDKADIRDTHLGLDFIRALRPVDFRWDMRDDYRNIEQPPATPTLINSRPGSDTFEDDQASDESALADYRRQLREWGDRQKLGAIIPDGSKKRNRYHHGVVAQEIQSLIGSGAIEDFGGFQDHSINGGDDVLSIGYEELIGPLIKAVQELSAKVATLEAGQ